MKPIPALSVFCFILSPAFGVTVLSEDFGTNGGSTSALALSTEGWAGYTGDSGVPAQPASPSALNRAGILDGTNGSGTTALERYMFAQNTTAATTAPNYLLYTTSNVTAVFPMDYTSVTGTWRRNADSGTQYHVAVQVGGDWYISENHLTTTTGTQTATFDFLTSSWTDLIVDETAGTGSLEAGTTTQSASGLFTGQTITGFGFFIDELPNSSSGNRTIRIDDINIEAVPEPSGALLGLAGLAGLCLVRRKA